LTLVLDPAQPKESGVGFPGATPEVLADRCQRYLASVGVSAREKTVNGRETPTNSSLGKKGDRLCALSPV